MYRLFIVGILLACLQSRAAGFDLLTGTAQAPPDIKPFKLSTLSGEPADYNGYINPLETAPNPANTILS